MATDVTDKSPQPQWTGGTWRVDSQHAMRVIVPERPGFGGRPYRVADAYFSSAGLADTPRIEEAQANAHLLAAAKELYAACGEALPWIARFGHAEMVDRLGAAMAHARGEP